MITAQDILNEKRTPNMVTISENAVIYDAIALMVKNKIGAMLVGKGDTIQGIWTERDFLRNTLEPGFDPKTARIGDYMNTDLIFADHNTPVIKLQEKFLGLFIRHILIKRGKNISACSPWEMLSAPACGPRMPKSGILTKSPAGSIMKTGAGEKKHPPNKKAAAVSALPFARTLPSPFVCCLLKN